MLIDFFITKIQEESEMWKQYELMSSKKKENNTSLSNESRRYAKYHDGTQPYSLMVYMAT